MGQLIPEDFPFEVLKNAEERLVVEAFRDNLPDRWIIVPDVGYRAVSQDHQTDIVLIHQDFGVFVIEVKGHKMQVRDGIWRGSDGLALDRQPTSQAKNNAHELRDQLRRLDDSLKRLRIDWCIALPNTIEIDGDLPADIQACQLILSGDMDDPEETFYALMKHHLLTRNDRSLDGDSITRIVNFISRNTDFKWDPESRSKYAKQKIESLCNAQVSILVSLMQNRRVVVTGGAGTGKTYLGIKWAEEALEEGDRVLMTCYNEPLASTLQERFGMTDGDPLVIGPFLKIVRELEGMPLLEVPNLTDRYELQDWWDTVPIGHVIKHWPKVLRSEDANLFDTIIVDEAQDFSPAWIGLLETLLDPLGKRRILLLADEGQRIYDRGFVLPDQEDGWVQVELISNYRNAHPIARILRRGLGGAVSPPSLPEGIGVSYLQALSAEAAIPMVKKQLRKMLNEEDRVSTRICVATLDAATRDLLRKNDDGFVRYEDRGRDVVVCETVHRLKGLEFDTVILVAPRPEDANDETPLYIGVSRAISELIVVGSREVADRLGLVRAGAAVQ